MHDRLDRLESRKTKLVELERKIGTVELGQNDLFESSRSTENLKR